MSDTPFQPLKGDPDLLVTKANHYEHIAEAISRSVTTLRKIHQVDGMVSKATAAMRDGADDVANDIEKAHDRYSTTAAALKTYASHLRTAQQDATAAIADIEAKEQAATAAATAANTAHTDARSASDDDKSDAQKAADKADKKKDDAQAALSAAHDKWYAALKTKNDAAKVAQGKIDYVVNGEGNHGLKDEHHWYDGIVKFAKAAYKVFKKICDIAGVLAIFLSWVPGLGEVLLALAAIGAVLDFIEAGVKFAKGEIGLGGFLLAGAGAVLTLFGGKILAVGAKGVRGMMVTRSAAKLASQGERGTAALARLEGVGAHSSKFMSTAAAKSATSEAKNAVTSFRGFGRAAKKAFKEGINPRMDGSSKMEVFKSSMKDAFGRKHFLGDDLASAWKMGLKNPGLVDGKTLTAGLTVTAGYATKDAISVYNSANSFMNGDHLSIPGLGGGYSDVAGFKDDLGDLGSDVKDLGHAAKEWAAGPPPTTTAPGQPSATPTPHA